MTQKIRIKLHAADGKKTHDWEFTFPPGTTQQHAQAVFDSLVTLSRYHPGTWKEIDRTTPSIIPRSKVVVMHKPNCATLFRGPFPGPCNCNPTTQEVADFASTEQSIADSQNISPNNPYKIDNHHSPTGSAPEAVKAKGSENRHAETHHRTVP